MSDKSTIEWTDATWNPVTGCTKISAGCANCYAERFAERWRGIQGHAYEQGFDLKLWPERLKIPHGWRKPRKIFVNSMSDLFHDDVPREYIKDVFQTMALCPRHTFQVLTKRAARLWILRDELDWPDNVWAGVSVENAAARKRILFLRDVPAAVKFLSCEPLLGPLPNMYLEGIDWVIVGGESGPKARPIKIEWVRDIMDQCRAAGIPFFFKQWGGTRPKSNGRLLDGREYSEFPTGRCG